MPRLISLGILLALFAAPASAAPQRDPVGPLLAPQPRQAAPAPFNDSRDKVKTSITAARTEVAPGDRFPVAVIFDHAKGWHIHTNDPKLPKELADLFVIKTQIEPQVEKGAALTVHQANIQWPPVHEVVVAFGEKPVKYGVFSERAVAYVPVTIAADAKPGPLTLTLRVSYQACDDTTCIRDAEEDLSLTLNVKAGAAVDPLADPAAAAGDFAGFDRGVWKKIATAPSRQGRASAAAAPGTVTVATDAKGDAGLIVVLLLAMAGGVLLNFMPCVLPVLPIKILSLTKDHPRRRSIALGAAMSLGVVFFWIVLGGVVAAANQFTPSRIFAYPEPNLAIGAFILIMALGLFGLFNVRLPNWVYSVNPAKNQYGGSFLFGIMTAVLALPCTAPLAGGAMGAALGKPPLLVLSVYAAVGVGMAFPYVILAAYPQLLKALPKTGPANELLKQVMALLMLAAGAWFLGIGIAMYLTDPTEELSTTYRIPVWLIIAAAGIWLAYRIARIQQWPLAPIVFTGVGLAMFVIGADGVRDVLRGPQEPVTAAAPAPSGRTRGGDAIGKVDAHGWTRYTPADFEALKQSGRILVVDFTAEWCLNCKVLEATVLNSSDVKPLLQSPDVVPIKVDLTQARRNPGWDYLLAEGFTGPPLLIVYAPDGSVKLKANAYTIGEVVGAIHQARNGGEKTASRQGHSAARIRSHLPIAITGK